MQESKRSVEMTSKMKLEKTKPHEVLKDPEQAEANRQQKRKAVGEVVLFALVVGLAFWLFKSPETLKASLRYFMGLFK